MMKCQESLTQDDSRKCTAASRRKARRSSNLSGVQKPVPLKQKSHILKSPIKSPSQPFQSILSTLRITPDEHDLFTMLLAPQQEPQGWSTEEDEEGKDDKFENDKNCDSSSGSRVESFNAREDQSQSAVGILQDIVDIDKAWVSWNGLPL
ncbi:hypothetical protein V502_07781 [Pseudogymnoascus sp. VKM F-4520 (FW-2644)]|nr:hypothetical protein V502_07781 [Pseudogymnoascus sp. VKM F-4520 (FW-2644)]